MQIKGRKLPPKQEIEKKRLTDARQYSRMFLRSKQGGLSRKLIAEYEELKKKYPNVK
jgi:hypothetical protein